MRISFITTLLLLAFWPASSAVSEAYKTFLQEGEMVVGKKVAYQATWPIRERFTVTDVAEQDPKPEGQSQPNFTGTWRHREALDAGTTLTILHRGVKLEIIRRRFAIGREFIVKNLYRLDGRTHITKQIEYIENSSTGKRQGYKTSNSRSKVAWQGDKLVIAENSERYVWELLENGKQLILTTGTGKVVYQKINEQ